MSKGQRNTAPTIAPVNGPKLQIVKTIETAKAQHVQYNPADAEILKDENGDMYLQLTVKLLPVGNGKFNPDTGKETLATNGYASKRGIVKELNGLRWEYQYRMAIIHE